MSSDPTIRQAPAAVAPALQLYLIRHGETEWSLSGKHTGRSDILLTQQGENKARELGNYLRHISFAQILSSPLRRAVHTCTLAGIGQALQLEPDLAEWDYGQYEGLRSVDILKLHPGWNIYRDGCPGGETPAQLAFRADRLLNRLLKQTGNIALFAHGQIGSVLAARWIGLALEEAQHFMLGTSSLGIFSFAPHHPAVPVIALWNAQPRVLFSSVTERPANARIAPAESSLERWENEGGEIPQVQQT